MKVLIVGPIASPIVRRLRHSLMESGCDVLVASHNAGGMEGVVNLGELKSFLGYFNFFKIRKLVKAYQPDLVHAHVLNHYGLMCLFQPKPLVVALWGSDVLVAPNTGGLLKKFIFKFINKVVLRCADRLHTSASHVASAAERQCRGVLKKTDVFYWGFPLKKPDEVVLEEVGRKLESEFSLAGQRYIIFPRGLANIYNPAAALKIIKAMLEEGVKSRIVVLRGFAGEKDLERFCDLLGVQGVTVIDRLLDEDELYFLYDRCDVHFSIPLSDSLGGGVIEPSLLGSFPVLSDLPSYRDYLANNSGYLLADYSADSIRDLVEKINSGQFIKSVRNAPQAAYGESSVLSRLKSTFAKVVSEKC